MYTFVPSISWNWKYYFEVHSIFVTFGLFIATKMALDETTKPDFAFIFLGYLVMHSMSPLPFALVLLSIEWARCLGEMIMVRRDSPLQIWAVQLQMSSKVFTMFM
jgi:hypothetical protein